jgi:hypothetical protein
MLDGDHVISSHSSPFILLALVVTTVEDNNCSSATIASNLP